MALFAAINIGLVAINGVRHGGDTPLYLDGANRVLEGGTLTGRAPSYLGYVWLVAAAQAIGIGTFGIVAVQVLLGAVAAAAVYSIGAALAGRTAGAVAAILYGLDADTNRWHQFILADSIYVSLLIIGVLLTHRAAIRGGAEPVVSAGAVLFGAGLVRPEGWFLIPAAAGYLVTMRARSAAQRLASAGALVGVAAVLTVMFAPVFGGNLQAVDPARMLERGQTIWEFDGWRIAMPPKDPAAPPETGAIGYAMRHPLSTVTLMLARVAVHFAHVRPFYSTTHNAVIVIWLVPLYVASLFAIWKLGAAPLMWWLLAAIGTQTLVVALTHAEWDGRYLAHVLPLFDALAGAAIGLLFARNPARSATPVHA